MTLTLYAWSCIILVSMVDINSSDATPDWQCYKCVSNQEKCEYCNYVLEQHLGLHRRVSHLYLMLLSLKLPEKLRHCILYMTMKSSMSISFSEQLSSKLKGKQLICILIYFCVHLSVTKLVKRFYVVITICMQLWSSLSHYSFT